jgi:DNA-binding winged helix-turn-helix (wHTH) protein/TolB-like protein/Tfp pilus assembly protein PilF
MKLGAMQSVTGSSVPDNSPSPDQLPGSPRAALVYEFEPFRLDPANRLLTRAGKEVPLPGRVFDVLLLLVSRPGALLTKEELMDSVWGGSFVEEANLTVAISTLRRALNEDPHERRYIQTVARRGYRFIAEVREVAAVPHASRVLTEAQDSEAKSVSVAAELSGGPSAPFAKPFARSWPLALVFALLVAGLLVGGWMLLKPRTPIRTLAVLPFTVEGPMPSGAPDEILLLGMTDELVSRLEGELVVRPTSSVLRYADGKAVDAVAAGREQNVDAVVTGTLESSLGRTRLRLRLYRVSDGVVLWQDSFSGAANGLAEVQQRAGEATTRELQRMGALSADSKAAANRPAAIKVHADDQAYQLYLRGRYFWNRRTVEGLRKSVDYFRQSIDADPNYAPAYAGLADSYALLASFSVEPGRSANADARSAALSAIQIDPTLAEPHASLGMIYFFTDWNLLAAQKEFEVAIRLNPNYATAHHWYALDLAAMNRPAEALYEIHLAQKLDPLSLIIGTNVGWIEYLAHDFPAALHDLHRVLELDPNFARARTRLGMVEMATGDNAAAVADLTQALALSGDEDPWVEGLLGDAQARAGNRPAAEHALAELNERSSSHYVPPISRALVLIGLGRRSEALAELAKAADDHSTSMVYARVDPSLDPLRSEAAFQDLLTRIKL